MSRGLYRIWQLNYQMLACLYPEARLGRGRTLRSNATWSGRLLCSTSGAGKKREQQRNGRKCLSAHIAFVVVELKLSKVGEALNMWQDEGPIGPVRQPFHLSTPTGPPP